VVPILISVLEKRLLEYPTTIETDEVLLKEPLTLNKRSAVVVRLGEKRIIHGTLQRLMAVQRSLEEPVAHMDKKRKVSGGEKKHSRGKKARQG